LSARVAHNFHLELFPADQRFLDQQFARRRRVQAAAADGLELFRVVGDAAAGAAQGERGADHIGKPTPPIASEISFCTAQASSIEWATPERADSRPNLGHRPA